MSGMNSRHSASSSGPPKNHRASALSAYASASMPPAYHSSPNQKTITSDGALSTAVSPLDDRPLDDRPRRMPPARCRVDRCDAREGRREAEGIEAAGRVRRLGCEPAKLITVALSGLSLSGARVDAFARAVDHKREPNRQRSLLASAMSSSGRLTTLLAVLAPLVAEAAKRTIKKNSKDQTIITVCVVVGVVLLAACCAFGCKFGDRAYSNGRRQQETEPLI
mmetsp:Transcript_5571/g.17599  ORF Transcript_5571/g.17599 Transcript_5571/m.17599 type:complete len:222 (-) Transcript_5571:120-785(-)